MNKPVFWVHGNRRQCRETWDKLVAHVRSKSGEEPNISAIYCGINPISADATQRWATATNLIQILRTKDMFDSRPRIIKVIGLPDGYSSITDWLHLVTGRNVLVFWGPFGHVKPGSKQWASAKLSKLYKAIKSEGKIVDHPLEVKTDSEAAYWVKEVASDHQKEISSSAARLMVTFQGKNLDTLTNSVEKLSIYQTGKEITIEDVKACCFNDYTDNVWGLLDHLDEQNTDQVLGYLQTFYSENKGELGESFYGRVSRFFGALLQHYQFLLLLKDVCGKTLNVAKAQHELATFKKATPTKIKQLQEGKITLDDLDSRFSKWYIENKMRSSSLQAAFARRKSEIYAIVSDLYNCMYWSRRYSSKPALLRLCLDTFALVVCGKLSLAQAAQIRGHQRKMGV